MDIKYKDPNDIEERIQRLKIHIKALSDGDSLNKKQMNVLFAELQTLFTMLLGSKNRHWIKRDESHSEIKPTDGKNTKDFNVDQWDDGLPF